VNTNYDIVAREFSFTTFNVNRDLHCWSMAFNFVPFGYMKSYSFTINAKSSMLKDLKFRNDKAITITFKIRYYETNYFY
jgi:hypothetical protein